MEVYQRRRPDGSLASPFWYYDLSVRDPYDPSAPAKRHRRSTGQRTKAKATLVAAQALREADEAHSMAPRTMTLRAAMDAYVGELEAQGKTSARDARSIRAKAFGLDAWATRGTHKLSSTLTLDRLNEGIIADYRRARLGEGLKMSSVALELRLLRATTLLAKRDRRLRVADVSWDIPTTRGKTRWLTPEEWKRVYDELDPDREVPRGNGASGTPDPFLRAQRQQAQDLLVGLTMCGGRWREVSSMTVDQLLPDGRVRLYGWKTKQERIVQAPALFREVLERRKAASQATGTPYLFPGNSRAARGRKGSRVAPQTCSRALRRAFDRAGCNEPHTVERDGTATAHSLRHTFASLLLQSGVSLQGVRDLLGHADITTTTRYTHLGSDALARAGAEAIGGALG